MKINVCPNFRDTRRWWKELLRILGDLSAAPFVVSKRQKCETNWFAFGVSLIQRDNYSCLRKSALLRENASAELFSDILAKQTCQTVR